MDKGGGATVWWEEEEAGWYRYYYYPPLLASSMVFAGVITMAGEGGIHHVAKGYAVRSSAF